MSHIVAIVAAIGCSLCNGISTVQQKIGADQEDSGKSFDIMLMLRLFKNTPYVIGTALELSGYGLSLVALRVLPLFLVQSLIAASVVVTAIGERIFIHNKISKRTIRAIGAVLAGLLLLSIGAVPSHASQGSSHTRILLEVSPLIFAALGLIFIYIRSSVSAMVIAALAGLSFGNTSTIGRIIIYPHPFWKIIENPETWGIIASALLGQYLFTVALQRATATKGNAMMIALQTLGPAACGLLFFNDKIRSGFEVVVIIGAALVIMGCVATAVDETPTATI
jgi:hypothetical protein